MTILRRYTELGRWLVWILRYPIVLPKRCSFILTDTCVESRSFSAWIDIAVCCDYSLRADVVRIWQRSIAELATLSLVLKDTILATQRS
jgi:hypothetical protein